jgi:hypothetical protein
MLLLIVVLLLPVTNQPVTVRKSSVHINTGITVVCIGTIIGGNKKAKTILKESSRDEGVDPEAKQTHMPAT